MSSMMNGAAQEGRSTKDIKLSDEIVQEINEKIKSDDFLTIPRSAIPFLELLQDKEKSFDWLVEGLIPRVSMGTIAGTSDIGKSTIMRQLALNITERRQDFLGFTISPVHFKAIMVYTEDLQDAVAYSVKKQIANKPPENFRTLRFIFDFENLLEKLDSELTQEPADFVVIDCFADPFGGDLKDTTHIRRFLGLYQRLVIKHRFFLMFVHHTGKRTEYLEPSKNNLLSGQGLEAKMRLVLEIRSDDTDDNLRHLCVVKGNYLSEAMKKESYVLRFDENTLTFSETGDRAAFRELVKTNDNSRKEKFHQATLLKAQGWTLDKIAGSIGYANKSVVSKLLSEGEKKGWGNKSEPKTHGNL